MANPRHDKTLVIAVVIALLGTVLAARVAFAYVGWLGVGLAGLLGLLISVRLDATGGAASASIPTSHGVSSFARQLDERKRLNPEQMLAETARTSHRKRALYLVNTCCLAMMGLGFTMFALHQL